MIGTDKEKSNFFRMYQIQDVQTRRKLEKTNKTNPKYFQKEYIFFLVLSGRVKTLLNSRQITPQNKDFGPKILSL